MPVRETMSDERRAGHSKLVYNKVTRTIDTVDPNPATPADIARLKEAGDLLTTLERITAASELTTRTVDGVTTDIVLVTVFKVDLREVLAALAEAQAERDELIKALRQIRYQLNLSQGMRADQARIHANAAVDQGLAQALTARHDSEA